MNLSNLLRGEGIDASTVLVLRHTPTGKERRLRKVLPRLAVDRPDLFNAYQQTQSRYAEKKMELARYVASFVGQKVDVTTFVGLYSVQGQPAWLTEQEYWNVRAHQELKTLGMNGFHRDKTRDTVLRFKLVPTDFYSESQGKLMIDWPPTARNWARFAHEKEMPVRFIKENALVAGAPNRESVDVDAEELARQAAATPTAADFEDGSPQRAVTTCYRVLRETRIARMVKRQHNYECQVCGETMVLLDGSRYAEAHHVKPLARKHNGPDRKENILCLCPNHHAQLDYGVRPISLVDLRCVEGHAVGQKYIDYHNSRIHKNG